MITIQSGMLVALGFLAASLLWLLVAPSFWSRAVRLTTKRLQQSIPLSELEIEADRDRIRAEYAIKMHKLETLVEQVKLAAARQHIEINRRDARVNMLEADLERLTATYEEAQNARRVLEQTIADRLPKVEVRLTEASRVLHARDRDIEELSLTSERQQRALAEAKATNEQQRVEMDRLTAALGQRVVRNARGDASSSDGDKALKAEVEALRQKTREQAQVLARMQSLAGRSGMSDQAAKLQALEAHDHARNEALPSAQQAAFEEQVRTLRARTDDQAAEIARLKAAIAVFEADGEGKGSVRESRVALKARLQSLEAQATQHTETIGKLRAELAAANERLARQATHFTSELKRLGTGAGASPSGRANRASVSARASLADRVAEVRGDGDDAAAEAKPVSPRNKIDRAAAELGLEQSADTAAESEGDSAAIREHQQPRVREVKVREAAPAGDAERDRREFPDVPELPDRPELKHVSDVSQPTGQPDRPAVAASPRPRLLDRIAGLSRGS